MVKKVIIYVLLISLCISLSLSGTVVVGAGSIVSKEQKYIIDKEGYSIIVLDEIEDTYNWGFSPAGYFDKSKKQIVIDSKYMNWAFNHEYGHFINNMNNYISDSDIFKSIYIEEKDKFKDENSEYAKTSPSEYFACAYKSYTENPKVLKENTPQTYYFIDNLYIN